MHDANSKKYDYLHKNVISRGLLSTMAIFLAPVFVFYMAEEQRKPRLREGGVSKEEKKHMKKCVNDVVISLQLYCNQFDTTCQ